MPGPTSTTSSRLLVAPRIPTFEKVPLIHSVLVNRYVPGARTIVEFEASEATAVCSCASVDTLTIAPDGAASGGTDVTDRANTALEDHAAISNTMTSSSLGDGTHDERRTETVIDTPGGPRHGGANCARKSGFTDWSSKGRRGNARWSKKR